MKSKAEQFRADQRAFGDAVRESYQPTEEANAEPSSTAGVRAFDFGEELAALAAAQRVGYIRGRVIA